MDQPLKAVMHNARTLFFDLDGTLTDSQKGILECISLAFGHLDHPLPPLEILMTFIGPPLRHSFTEILGAEKADIAVGHFRRHYEEDGIGISGNTVYPGMIEILQALQTQGRQMRVVTSKPRPIASKIVAHFGLDRYLSRVYGPDDDAHHDKADLIAEAMREENVAAADIVMIGDRKFDVLGAAKNGIRSIGVLWGYGGRAELEEAGATEIVASPAALLDRLTAADPAAMPRRR